LILGSASPALISLRAHWARKLLTSRGFEAVF
jgi:hypothetical protein